MSAKGLLYPLRLGEEVNFRLTYDGRLKAQSQSNPRRDDKQAIRRHFHMQLMQLWRDHPALIEEQSRCRTEDFGEVALSRMDIFRTAERFKRGKFRFLPLVRRDLHLVCDLDILFLRREIPGGLLQSGDLDNRIKTLFDALSIPNDDQIHGFEPTDAEKLFFCLLEDDSLITGFRVRSDRLLEPLPMNSGPEIMGPSPDDLVITVHDPLCDGRDESKEKDVRLIINVEVMATKLTPENMAYFSHF